MSNSSLVNYTKISPNSNPRTKKISKITIHHMAGNGTVEGCGAEFAKPSREASSNYGIDSKGRVGMYVEEKNRAWTSGNEENDQQAVTIEVANDEVGGNWHVSDTALSKLIELCVDICKRNGIKQLNYTGNKSGNLTMHKWFQPTVCPGPYLESKFPYIANEVNKQLTKSESTSSKKTVYCVQVGAFSKKQNADNLLSNLKKAGFEGYIVAVDDDAPAPAPTKKSNEEIAREVIAGKWGNGAERKRRLTQAGYDYSEVQKCVNKLLTN